MKILHVFRTPVGGLFRHVCDLAAAQAERGHQVGALYDSSTGDALSQTSRALLLDWMRRTETGARRLRAGLPPAWNAGDKTGTGVFADLENKYNDVAVAFPGVRSALAIAAYYEAPGVFPNIRAEDEAVLAEVGRLTTQWLSA